MSLVSTVVSALCEHVEQAAEESALFVHDERPEQISVDTTEEVEASFDR